jgi:hypothetical protein
MGLSYHDRDLRKCWLGLFIFSASAVSPSIPCTALLLVKKEARPGEDSQRPTGPNRGEDYFE